MLEYLDDLYIDVGHYAERLVTKTCEGREGVAQIKALMEAFRSRPAARDRRADAHRGLRLPAARGPPLGRPGSTRPCPSPRATCSSSTPTSPAAGSPRGPRGPSRRSSSTSSPAATWTAPTACPPRRNETRRLLDRMEADLGQYIDEVLKVSS